MTAASDNDALVLALLLDADREPLSGQIICEKLDLPRRSLLDSIDSLRSRGFLIVASGPGWGYHVAGLPDGLTEEQILPLLETNELGRKLHYRASIASTNDEAHRLAEEGAAHGEAVIAEEQSEGRGRRGRTWVSPPGKSLALSVVLRPTLPPARAPELTLVAAVAVCETARDRGAPTAAIKWPNDVECGGRKLAGLLTELRADADRIAHVVIGIGVNLNAEERDFPPELRPLATSLRIESGALVPRGLFCARLLGRLEDWLGMHEALGFGPVRDRYQELTSTVGRTVRVEMGHLPGVPLIGEAIDVDETGALLVRVPSGAVHRVMAGDIEHLRGG